jgi:hypothetical protein
MVFASHTQRIREINIASHFDMTPAYLIVAMHKIRNADGAL